MSDIAEQIRAEIRRITDNWPECQFDVDLAEMAAAELTRLRAENAAADHAAVKYLVQIDEQANEIERLRAALCADDQTLRLYLGEMTAQEMRTLKAGFNWVLARAALQQESSHD